MSDWIYVCPVFVLVSCGLFWLANSSAGGFGRYVAEWLLQSIVAFSGLFWSAVFAVIVLPYQAIMCVVAPKKPKEFSSVLITGASSGIGAELAKCYAKPGVKLVLTARRAEKLAAVKMECEALGADVKTVSVDVNDKDAMNKAIGATDNEWPLDLVIANAGIEENTLMLEGKDPLGLDIQHAVNSTNCLGVVNTVCPAIERMKQRKHGQIVIMSSIVSVLPLPVQKFAAYSASKMWARSYGLALRGALQDHGIGVTTVCPGFTESEMIDDFRKAAEAGSGSVLAFVIDRMVISTKTMVDRTKEAIAHDVPEFIVPFNALAASLLTIAMNAIPPTLRMTAAVRLLKVLE